MIDPVQIVLLVVIIVLTILLVILGVQVFLILRDLRKTVQKATDVLENVDSITESVEEPLSALSSLVLGLKTGSFFTILKTVSSFINRNKNSKKEKE